MYLDKFKDKQNQYSGISVKTNKQLLFVKIFINMVLICGNKEKLTYSSGFIIFVLIFNFLAFMKQKILEDNSKMKLCGYLNVEFVAKDLSS